MKYCPWCGASRVDDAAFCVEFGRDLFSSQRPAPQPDPPDIGAADEQGISPARPGCQPEVTTKADEPIEEEPRTIEKQHSGHTGKKMSAKVSMPAPEEEPNEEQDFSEGDEYDDQARFSYYDDVVPINENDRSDQMDKKVIMKIAVIGCVVLAVIALSVMAMLYL